MFAREPADVVRPTILDCAAGPSSFAAEATTLGGDLTGVDPAYARPLADLRVECASTVDRTAEQLAEKRDRYEWGFYGDVDTRFRLLRAASERFVADAARSPGRYVAGALPALPFERDAFEFQPGATAMLRVSDTEGYCAGA